jgi:hypothetical protein
VVRQKGCGKSENADAQKIFFCDRALLGNAYLENETESDNADLSHEV